LNPNFFAENNSIAVLEKVFKLSTSISMKNMVGFNSHKRLQRYMSALDIMEEFYEVRLQFYGKRKDYLVSKLVRDC
jgi:DNA topoisomerase-2